MTTVTLEQPVNRVIKVTEPNPSIIINENKRYIEISETEGTDIEFTGDELVITVDEPVVSVVKVETERQILTIEPEIRIIEIVERGLQGPAGPSGGGYITVTGGAGGVLAFQVVYINDNDTVLAANTLNPTHCGRIVGITSEAIPEGETGEVIKDGEVTNPEWNLIPGEPYFLGEGGEISLYTPTTSFIQRLGVAKNNTTLIMELGEPILRI